MTVHKNMKSAIRERMKKTGERFTAARAQLLSEGANDSPEMVRRLEEAGLLGPCNCLDCVQRTLDAETNRWRLNTEELKLELRDTTYYVDLEECPTSAATLDWIFQVEKKGWGVDVVGGLVRALQLVLDPQANLCSWQEERGPVDWADALRSRKHRKPA